MFQRVVNFPVICLDSVLCVQKPIPKVSLFETSGTLSDLNAKSIKYLTDYLGAVEVVPGAE